MQSVLHMTDSGINNCWFQSQNVDWVILLIIAYSHRVRDVILFDEFM